MRVVVVDGTSGGYVSYMWPSMRRTMSCETKISVLVVVVDDIYRMEEEDDDDSYRVPPLWSMMYHYEFESDECDLYYCYYYYYY